MSERQKNFDPFVVFPQMCAKAPLLPKNFGFGMPEKKKNETPEEKAAREKIIENWKKFCKENGIASRFKGTSTIDCDYRRLPEQETTENERVFAITPAAMPKGLRQAPYYRLAVKRPLIRPFDLAMVFDPQGKPLMANNITPRDELKDKGVPKGATEWYYGPAAIIMAVSARGRVSCHTFELEERGGVHYLRVAKIVDITIALLQQKLSNPAQRKELLPRLENAQSFLEQIEELFSLVNHPDQMRLRGEPDAEYFFRCRQARIEKRRRYEERDELPLAPEDESDPPPDDESDGVPETAEKLLEAVGFNPEEKDNGNGAKKKTKKPKPLSKKKLNKAAEELDKKFNGTGAEKTS